MLVVIIVVVGVCRRRLRVGTDASASVEVSVSSGQQDDVERLLATDNLFHRPAGPVDDDDDDDDDELHRGPGASNSGRLDFNVTRMSSRRCLVETDEIDTERMSLFADV